MFHRAGPVPAGVLNTKTRLPGWATIVGNVSATLRRLLRTRILILPVGAKNTVNHRSEGPITIRFFANDPCNSRFSTGKQVLPLGSTTCLLLLYYHLY